MAKFKELAQDKAGFGWVPDVPDFRDHKYKAPYGTAKSIPASADLTRIKGYFDPYDQLKLGSCTGNAIAGALQFDALVQGAPLTECPSRLFVYFGERVIEGTVGQDAGASLRDGIKVVSKYGTPPESVWPYSDDASTFKKTPSPDAFKAALTDRAVSYRRLTRDASLTQMRAALGVEGKPFVFGFSVYESFMSDAVANTGVVPMPSPGEVLLGGHAVLAVGFDTLKQLVKCRNSWGTDHGDKGHFYLPFGYFTDRGLSSDFWVIQTTSVVKSA